MNTYKYKIYVDGSFVDISAYINTNAFLSDKIDETLNVASFTIPHIRADKVPGLDLSKPIKPWTPFIIDINNGEAEFAFYTGNSTRTVLKKTSPELYKHDVDLIEGIKIFQRKTIPNISVTQPKGAVFQGRFYSDLKADAQFIANTEVSLIPTVVNQSNDLTKVSSNTLKANSPDGKVFLTLDCRNFQYDYNFNFWIDETRSDGIVQIQADIYSNGILLSGGTKVFTIPPTTAKMSGSWYDAARPLIIADPETYTKSFFVDIPEDTVDQVITVKLKTLGSWHVREILPILEYDLTDGVEVTSYLTVSADITEAEPFTYLNEEVTKILSSIETIDENDTYTSKYVIDSITNTEIANIECPEFTFDTSTAFDALVKCANVVNAQPILLSDFKTVAFRNLDEIADLSYDRTKFNDETLSYTLDTYNSALETNAQNVIEEDSLKNAKFEPYADGWMTIRANSEIVGQITEDNAAFKTRQLIYRVYKMFIKGVRVTITDGVTTKDLYGNVGSPELSSSYWDISSRVKEESEWNAYENSTQNKSDTYRLNIKTKGNHIYYKQGSKYVQGLGYKTDTLSDIVGSTEAPRALLETIMAKAAEYIGDTDNGYSGYTVKIATNSRPEAGIYGDEDTGGAHQLFEGIRARVQYMPLASIRSSIYKHNVYDLDLDITNFANEQDKLTDTTNLSGYITKSLNKLGNLEYTVSGIAYDYGDIPKLGYRTYNDLVVVGRTLNMNKNLIDYSLNLSENFINQSSWVNTDSGFRQFEVPNNDTVFRQDKYREFVVLTKSTVGLLPKDYTILNAFGNQRLVQNFSDVPGNYPISYAKATITKEKDSLLQDNIVSYDLPIDGFPTGTTVNLQMEFDTNYSAGPYKYDSKINGEDVKIQSYTNYTSQFGQVYKLELDVHPRGLSNNNETDADLYPKFNSASSDNAIIEGLSLIINKDAREKYGLNIEIPFISSDSSTIRVYEGIAKYNGLIREKDEIDVKVALLEEGYFPSVNQRLLDTKRANIQDITGTSTYQSGVYGIRYNGLIVPGDKSYEGYAVFEATTNILIYAVKETVPVTGTESLYNTANIWFVSKTHLTDRTIPE